MCPSRDRYAAGTQIGILNRQRKHQIHTGDLCNFARDLVPLVQKAARTEIPREVLVVLVSDRRISSVHQQFMGIAGPTDVITFQDGEIIVSVETAARQAIDYETDLLHELRLYIAHGLLHLAGFDDHTEEGFREMAKMQAELVARVDRQINL